MLHSVLVLLLSISQLALCSSFQEKQAILTPYPTSNAPFPYGEHVVEEAILTALKTHSDPVAALLYLRPELSADLAQPRLLHVIGDQKPEWMTEGDKLCLRKRGKKFVDITDHENFYAQQAEVLSGKASMSLLNWSERGTFVHHVRSPKLDEATPHQASFLSCLNTKNA